jgi:hypothetical protein
VPVVRMVATLPMDSGLPEDAVQNVWHFDVPIVTDPTLQDIADAVSTEIYNAVDSFMSVKINEAACGFTFYNLADSEPRQPIYETGFTAGFAPGSTAIPSEVALVGSFQGDSESGQPQARRRGRVFIGPLAVAALGAGAAGDRPAATFVGELSSGLADLRAASEAAVDWNWVVWSPTSGGGAGAAFIVTNGWVDDAFDTQRRRGVSPTMRDIF